MKKGEHSYGGKYWGWGGKWFFIWFSDYTESRIVKNRFQLEIGSRLWGNKTFSL